MPHPIATQLRHLETELNEFYLEREDVIRTALLALLAAEHLFILGSPGTAKSDLIVRIFNAIKGARHMEVALSKHRPSEAVLGPLDVKRFRETGEYLLRREGYATQVELLFLDEIGKMSAILGHDLLALLNERKYHEVTDGRSAHPAPLSSAFCASNEMLTEESDDAAATFDRLLFRIVVENIQGRGNFARLLTASDPVITTEIKWDELKQAIDDEVPAIQLSEATVQSLVNLREAFRAASIVPSDRRWRACRKALQASAFLAGRTEVLDEDLEVLRFVLWDTLEQRERVERLCLSASSPFVDQVFELREQLREVNDALTEREAMDKSDFRRTQYGPDAHQKLEIVRTSLDMMLMEAQGRRIPFFKVVSDLHEATLLRMYTGILDMPDMQKTKIFQDKLGMGAGGNL